jgi:F-type H+-transporting ATPase subunit delta
MSNYRVAFRYAKSLIELAIELDKLEVIKTDMEMLYLMCKDSRPFLNFIKSPIIHVYKKRRVFEVLFKSRIDALSFKFAEILITKGREGILSDIAEQFLEQYRVFKGIKTVEVIVPIELDKELRSEFIALSKKLVGVHKKIELHEKVDKDILGGYILRLGDRQIDDSVSTKLKELKKKLIVS